MDRFERLIRRDPARRGLIGGPRRVDIDALAASDAVHPGATPVPRPDAAGGEGEPGRLSSRRRLPAPPDPLFPGHLASAAAHLAEHGSCVGLVTGFYIPAADPPAAETDGPPGALLLASALEACGIESWVITDAWCAGAVQAAADAWGFDDRRLLVTSDRPEEGFFYRDPGRRFSHLVSVERVGPGHTLESLAAQPREGAPPREAFCELVPPESRGRCHNMRGEVIDEWTSALHGLFEDLKLHLPQAKTVGIGDGGNEIGMGSAPWEELVRRLEGAHAARIPCRVATDWTIVAGTSNWGAAALAAGVLLLRGRVAALRDWDREHERSVLEAMVAGGPAVDGVTRRREATVDGLPFLTYIQPWDGIRRLLGMDG